MSYGFVGTFLLVLIEGAVLYVIDRHIGTRVYRWWYNTTHKNELPANDEYGFIHQRKAHSRFSAALFIAFIQNALAVWGKFESSGSAVLWFSLEIPILMVGFYLGPFINRIWERKKIVLDEIDRLESKEITFGQEIKRAATLLHETVITPQLERLTSGEETHPAEKQAAEEPEKKQESEPETDPREYMRKFTERR